MMLLFSTIILILWFAEKQKKNIQFLGFWSFIIWLAILIGFTSNSILITRGIGYTSWLVIFFLFMLTMGLYVRSYPHYQKLLFMYIRSFTIIGVLAVVQLLGVLLGFKSIISFYFMSGIPRIHGFSYEPSYFSTYLIIPWTFHFFLYFTKSNELKKQTWNLFSLLLLTFVILLSFSRMGILLMSFIIFGKLCAVIIPSILRLKIKRSHFYFFSVSLFLVGVLFFTALLNLDSFISLFEGLPFFSEYAHSASIRMDSFLHTWKVFLHSPLYGYSLGGVAPAIAKLNGITSITQEIVKNYEGLCVFLEILAASGILGFVFFAFFLSKILFSTQLLKKEIQKSNQGFSNSSLINIHNLLLIGLIAQLILLCLNQNVLRNYLWVHFSILNLSFFLTKEHIKNSDKTLHD
jgi:hypothetical protein